tara:strand:+ start:299 stop:565 length:267 start_codon:yes stop_codon:yes gene_type:complete
MIFKKDAVLLGVLLGLVTPVIFWCLQKLILELVGWTIEDSSMKLFALMFNLPVFRYYMINLKYEKTGKGVLFLTFIWAIIWIFDKGLI